jgi:GTP 3',8-cyclase
MTCLSDSFQRPIDYLRVSVTDRCNLRCIYCMPPDGVEMCPHQEILSYEEIIDVVRAAAQMGISKVRVTGGEPLVRLGITDFIRMLRGIDGIDDISMTTNGVLLAGYAAALKEAGLDRVNVSLDTLKPERFRQITRAGSELDEVLGGIAEADRVGLKPVKINIVAMAGINDDEVLDFARKTLSDGWHIRFIERMPFYGDVDYAAGKYISAKAVKERLWSLGKLERSEPHVGNGPARYYRLPGASGTIGFITALSEHFCFSCNRLRLTADGKLRPCLMDDDEIDLRPALRGGNTPERLKDLIVEAIERKPLRHHMSENTNRHNRPFYQVGG